MPPIEVDTNVSPYEWLNEEPAKKLYWCTGLAGSVDEKGICITHTIVLTTEHAAWVRRAQELAEYSDFVTTIGNPRCVSREEIDLQLSLVAREWRTSIRVFVQNEQLETVEYWDVE